MEISLTQNGIIHISAGFDGPFILQAFSVRKHPTIPNQLNMCLTDGVIYIGASYQPPKFFQMDNFNIVKVTAQYFDRMRPIAIKTLEVLSRGYKKLIGSPPCTLGDYFNNEMLVCQEVEPKKKVKITPEDTGPLVLPDLNFFEKKPQRIDLDDFEPIKDIKKKEPKAQKQSKKSLKKLKLDSQQQQDFANDLHSSSLDNFKATFVKDSVQTVSPSLALNIQDMVQNSFIRDLFQRHTGWIILCRVNYRSLAKCENGMYAVNFVLTDQSRDEIKCVLFEADLQKAKQLLTVGKYYLFTCGQVKEYHEGELQIIFDKNSYFLQKQNVHFNVNPKKLTRINKILQESPQHDINVIGIVRKIKNKGQKLRTKSKYVATICDPITNYEIDFLLFLNDDDKPIQRGMIVVLHSYQIYKLNNICRLNSTYRSYYYQQHPHNTDDKHDLVNQFHKYIQANTWDNENYRNISMFAFTQRPIHELKTIHKKTNDDRVYSSVDCWIMEISRKKSYYACKTCKKPTEKKEMSGLFFCIHCKKMVDVLLTLTLSVTFTDSTGSCMIDVIGEHAQNIIQKRALQFYALPMEDQNHHLQSLRYKNVQLRLKTQRKQDGKLGHSVWGIEKTRPEIPLKEIQKLLSDKSAKLDDKW